MPPGLPDGSVNRSRGPRGVEHSASVRVVGVGSFELVFRARAGIGVGLGVDGSAGSLAHGPSVFGEPQVGDAGEFAGGGGEPEASPAIDAADGLECLFPRPKCTVASRCHTKYPYLLKGLEIECPGQVWSAVITYVPMPSGFMYLVATIDWYSRPASHVRCLPTASRPRRMSWTSTPCPTIFIVLPPAVVRTDLKFDCRDRASRFSGRRRRRRRGC